MDENELNSEFCFEQARSAPTCLQRVPLVPWRRPDQVHRFDAGRDSRRAKPDRHADYQPSYARRIPKDLMAIRPWGNRLFSNGYSFCRRHEAHYSSERDLSSIHSADLYRDHQSLVFGRAHELADWMIILLALTGVGLFFLDQLSLQGLSGVIAALGSGSRFAWLTVLMRHQRAGSPEAVVLSG